MQHPTKGQVKLQNRWVLDRIANTLDYLFVFATFFAFLYPEVTEQIGLYSTFWYTSLLAGLLSYLIVSSSLKRRGIGLERTFLALATIVSGAWVFETIYRYAFITTLAYLPRDFLQLVFYSNVLGPFYPLPVALAYASLPFIGVRLMSLNRWFLISGTATFVLFAFWMASGYPQVFRPNGFFFLTPFVPLDANQTRLSAAAFSLATKISTFVCISTLFCGRGGPSKVFN